MASDAVNSVREGPAPDTPRRAIIDLAEMRATWRLAWPLVAAQLAAIAINTTDIILIGWLGPVALAGGSLGFAVYFPLLMFGVGVVTAAAPMISQAIGAGDVVSVRRTTRQAVWVAVLLGALLTALVGRAGDVMLAIGQEPAVVAGVRDYVDGAKWLFAPALIFYVFRYLTSAHGETSVVLIVTLLGVVVNAVASYALIFGALGAPRLGLYGAGLASSAVFAVMAAAMALYVRVKPLYAQYTVFVRVWRADWPRFWEIWRLGAPIGFTMTAETGLFSGAAVLIGWLGAEALAGHTVALKLASITFMIPLGISQAATIRVGHALGRGDPQGVRRAGWTAMLMALAIMVGSAALFLLFPRSLAGLFLAPDLPENAAAIAYAVAFLAVAALFQIVDGAQVVAAAALRGLSDTAIPMAIALTSYWGVGLGASYVLGFTFGLGGVGVWLGLAAGLAAAAVVLCWRFARLSSDAALRA